MEILKKSTGTSKVISPPSLNVDIKKNISNIISAVVNQRKG